MIKILLILSIFFALSQVHASDLSDIILPPDTTTSWVGSEIVQNGIPMQIQQFKSRQSIREILVFYRNQWAERGAAGFPGAPPTFVEKKIGAWHVISKLDGDTNLVIQLKAGKMGGSEGYISTANISAKAEQDVTTRGFPRMGGTQLISSTASRDGDKAATTIIFKNNFSVISNNRFYRTRLATKGWRLAHETVEQGTAVMLFNKNGLSCEIAISQSDQGMTVIFANIVG